MFTGLASCCGLAASAAETTMVTTCPPPPWPAVPTPEVSVGTALVELDDDLAARRVPRRRLHATDEVGQPGVTGGGHGVAIGHQRAVVGVVDGVGGDPHEGGGTGRVEVGGEVGSQRRDVGS